MNIADPRRTLKFTVTSRITMLTAGTLVALLLACSCAPIAAYASGGSVGSSAKTGGSEETGGGLQLEKAAATAGKTGQKVAMSLIGLAFAIAAIVLAFRRDFKEAAGVLAIGVVAIFLANTAGVEVLKETVEKLFKA
jgi:hypothetical protein